MGAECKTNLLSRSSLLLLGFTPASEVGEIVEHNLVKESLGGWQHAFFHPGVRNTEAFSTL